MRAPAFSRFAPAFISLAAAALTACGGSPNTPGGPVVGTPGSPNPPSTHLVNAKVTVTLPARTVTRSGRGPEYLSANTESISIGLASVNGQGVTGVGATVINTTRKAQGCKTVDRNLVCSAMLSASPGEDVFNVIAYRWPNATGDILAAGTLGTHMPSGGAGFGLSSALSIDVGGVIAKLTMHASPPSVKRGKPAAIAVTLDAFDASGALIVGNNNYNSSVTLSIQGDGTGAFLLHDGSAKGSTIAVVRPPKTLALAYDGNPRAPSSITLQASVSNPNPASASANVSVTGTPPPLPPGTIYTLNAGTRSGAGATVTVYDGTADGNAAPKRTLNLEKSLYARSIVVDSKGNLYVGYLDNTQGFSSVDGTPDQGNEVAIYAPTASGNAKPASVIAADPKTSSALFPIALALDTAGNLVTYGASTVDANSGDAVLVYAPGSMGPVAPVHAWSFASPTLRYAGPTGLALDSADDFFVNGALHTSLGPNNGIFTNTAQNVGSPNVAPARVIPWDSKTKLVPGQVGNLSLDATGEIFVANYTVQRGATTSCQAQANAYAGAATGGTTDVSPLRVLKLAGVATTNPLCYSPSNVLAGYYPSIFAYGTAIYATDEFDNAVDAFAGADSGNAKPSKHIAGSATAINVPIGVFVAPPPKGQDAQPAPTATPSSQLQLRFVEGAPLLETNVGGAPLPLGTSFLSVNGLTIASTFIYGTITQFVNGSAGVVSVTVADSLGYKIGPFKTPALAAGNAYTIALVGSYPRYRLLTFQEPKPAAGATLAVYGASPTRPAADYGSFIAATGKKLHKLGAVRLGKLATSALGTAVTDFGAYVGKGRTPISGGKLTLRSVDSFDRRNVLPFHNVARFSLFLLDPSSGSTSGPVFGVFDQ